MRIVGAGADLSGIDGNGENTGDRVLYVLTGTLTMSGVTIHDGSAPSSGIGGGGIFVDSPAAMRLIDSTVSGNNAVTGGGGIFAGGTATLINSTVSGNSASDARRRDSRLHHHAHQQHRER